MNLLNIIPRVYYLFWGCCVLISKKTFDRIGKFDSNIFIWAHELEFMMRFYSQGGKAIYATNIYGFHMSNPFINDLNKKRYSFMMNIKNFFYISAKYFTGLNLFLVVFNLSMRIMFYIKNDITFLRYFIKFIFDCYRNFKKGLNNKSYMNYNIQNFYISNFVEFANPILYKFNNGLYHKLREDLYPINKDVVAVSDGKRIFLQ